MNNSTAEKRELTTTAKKGLSVSDLVLIGILLAAGAVLKYFVGSIINIGGMKPNFIIAMYCLAILLIKPKIYEAGIIGLIAGALCQLLPGTPYLNFISEFFGALAMSLLILLPLQIEKFDFRPIVCTFISTVISGSIFVASMFLFTNVVTKGLAFYVPMVLGTAAINAALVQILYIPLKLTVKKSAKS